LAFAAVSTVGGRVGRTFNVTSEQIRRIENRSLKRLQRLANVNRLDLAL
jgi:DNA-directed RNA polymerase sigma subunit (sigma70/sigma32)